MTDLTAGATATDGVAAELERWRWTGPAVTWDDVVGHEPAKRELRVVAEQVRRVPVAERLGLTGVTGILLMGPAGSGKTLLARALATAIDRPAYVIPAAEADAAMIREVYEHLAGVPCLVVWDEADSILRDRWTPGSGSANRAVAAFCAAVSGMDSRSGPITIALTAEPEYRLDSSAIRAGRLTTKVELAPPTADDRRVLWTRAIAEIPVAGAIDMERLVERSAGMSGADIIATVMAALGLSMVDGMDALTPPLLDEALLRRHRVVERPARQPADRRRTAIHEAGHAVYATLVWGPESVSHVTTVPTGGEAGRTELAEAWRNETETDRRRLHDLVGLAYAGMVAEELEYGPTGVGAGCRADIVRATRLLRHLVGDLGAVESIGPVALDVLEAGADSDRGSAPMREDLWEAVWTEATIILAAVRSLLAPHHDGIRHLGDALLASSEGTLSGPDLQAALQPFVGVAR